MFEKSAFKSNFSFSRGDNFLAKKEISGQIKDFLSSYSDVGNISRSDNLEIRIKDHHCLTSKLSIM